MTIAHIAGLPLEELLAPLIVTGSSLVIAVRDALRRHSRRPRVVRVQE